jgi:hypothetical protein
MWLDGDVLDRVRQAFVLRCEPAYVDDLEQARDRRCAALVAATDAARDAAAGPGLDAGTARSLLREVDARMSELIPYPILTKFVPELLLQTLRDAGDEGPVPLPIPSPGARLSGELLDLYVECRALGYGGERLETEWPEVDPVVVTAVRSFCDGHTGFGPVTWEAPGMETPAFVIGSMRTAFDGADPQTLLARRPRASTPEGDERDSPDPWVGQLRRTVRTWLEYQDMEIWYLRGAFYRGVVPLLRRCVLGGCGEGTVAPSDLLFAKVRDLIEGPPAAGTLEPRRARYWADTEYLTRNSIRADRLTGLMEGS